jgi:heptosyltransferase-2
MKVLIIRFSSIGDIVLTTPVIRCINQQLNAEVHYLIKAPYAGILNNNPYIHAMHKLRDSKTKLLRDLKREKFDLVIDLHKNIRSRYFTRKLGVKTISFDKSNFRKWLLTAFKINILAKIHIVDRYFNSLKSIKVLNDGLGLDYFTDHKDDDAFWTYPGLSFNQETKYIAVAIGAAHKTKVPTLDLYTGILKNIKMPVVLLGGKQDINFGDLIVENTGAHVINLAGKISLGGSAVAIRDASVLITPDTGLMHIGSAMQKNIISIWGNTVPDFGMYPYYGNRNIDKNYSFEVDKLSCRPCSKIGYNKCPKGHFNCMKLQNVNGIIALIDNIVKA